MIKLYLHLGKKVEVKTSDIIGIFDMDTATIQKGTRDFLYEREKNGKIKNVSQDLPKSFTLVQNEKGEQIFVGPLMVSTLVSRLNATDQIKLEK